MVVKYIKWQSVKGDNSIALSIGQCHGIIWRFGSKIFSIYTFTPKCLETTPSSVLYAGNSWRAPIPGLVHALQTCELSISSILSCFFDQGGHSFVPHSTPVTPSSARVPIDLTLYTLPEAQPLEEITKTLSESVTEQKLLVHLIRAFALQAPGSIQTSHMVLWVLPGLNPKNFLVRPKNWKKEKWCSRIFLTLCSGNHM